MRAEQGNYPARYCSVSRSKECVGLCWSPVVWCGKSTKPAFILKEGKNCFLIAVAIMREVIWKTQMRGMTGNLVSGLWLMRFFILHLKSKVRLERCLSERMFKARWMWVHYCWVWKNLYEYAMSLGDINLVDWRGLKLAHGICIKSLCGQIKGWLTR